MRIFAIRDDDLKGKVVAYLLYYEVPKAFYIELPEGADEWETPLLLSSFVKRRQHTVNSYWSREWVRQRIVPQDRQNIGQVLKENGLKCYDEFDLLMLFVKNEGTAFSREQILNRIWGENYYGSDRVVDDTMRRLRKKLSELNVQTIYGYGYRLG